MTLIKQSKTKKKERNKIKQKTKTKKRQKSGEEPNGNEFKTQATIYSSVSVEDKTTGFGPDRIHPMAMEKRIALRV